MTLISAPAERDAAHARPRARWAAADARRVIPPLLGGALALPLLAYATVGGFSRYTADDYCWAGILRVQGFVQAQVHWYTVYSPRYAFTFLVNLVELAGPGIVPFLPAAAIVGWLAGLTWALARVGRGLTPAAVLAALIAFATLQTAPDRPQSLYWQTGLLTYLLPLILATVFAAWVRVSSGAGNNWWRLAVSFGLAYVAGGLSETYLIPQNVGLTLAIVAAWLMGRRVLVPQLAAGWLGGVAALLTILVAPSTAARVGGSPADLWLASAAAVATAAVQAGQLVRHFPLTVLLCLGVPAALSAIDPLDSTRDPRSRARELVMVTSVVALTLPFCYFPSFYAQNGNPPARSLIVPQVLFIGYLVYLGTFAGPLARRFIDRGPALAPIAVVAALALVPVAAAAASLPDVVTAGRYASLWDAEDASIRSMRDAGATRLMVPPLPPNLGEQFVTANPTYWFNSCVARYYGVDSIVAVGPP